MIWGGLRPVKARFFLDVYALAAFTYCSYCSVEDVSPISINALVLLSACLTTLVTAGFMNRWTISFPMVPILLLQMMRHRFNEEILFSFHPSSIIRLLTFLCIVISAALTVLFPAVEVPPLKGGKYNVGFVELYLPVREFDGILQNAECSNGDNDTRKNVFVSARLFYPTLEKLEAVPYLNLDIANLLCDGFMKIASPPPMQRFKWILRFWKFARLPVKRNAVPIRLLKKKKCESSPASENKIPLAAFSHGVMGNSCVYSYQTMNLASNGALVLVIDHTDGSAIVTKRHDGSYMHFDLSIQMLEAQGKLLEQVRARRDQVDYRASELLSGIKALQDLNNTNIPQLEEVGVSFVNLLDVQNITISGHSMGAATAIAAASREPNLFSCVIAHDPAIDWIPDYGRKALFSEQRLASAGLTYDGGTGGYKTGESSSCTKSAACNSTFHNLDMLFLYSHEFVRNRWGNFLLLKSLHRSQELGSRSAGLSDVGFIYNAQHTEFSDVPMMLPLWLTRAVGITGKRNPIETADEIAHRTLEFYNAVKGKKTRVEEELIQSKPLL